MRAYGAVEAESIVERAPFRRPLYNTLREATVLFHPIVNLMFLQITPHNSVLGSSFSFLPSAMGLRLSRLAITGFTLPC